MLLVPSASGVVSVAFIEEAAFAEFGGDTVHRRSGSLATETVFALSTDDAFLG